MVFSTKDLVLIKVLRQEKGYDMMNDHTAPLGLEILTVKCERVVRLLSLKLVF